MDNYLNSDGVFSSETLPNPDFFNFASSISEKIMLYSSAAFTRTSGNSNTEIDIIAGPDISPGTIWYSPNTYLSANILNLTRPITEIIYYENRDARILTDLKFLHDVLIQYKLTATDDSEYVNQREIRCSLVREDGTTIYDSSLVAYQQPDSGKHDTLLLRGYIDHSFNDLVRIKLNIVQDNSNNGVSDTRLTILRINWNILGLGTSL